MIGKVILYKEYHSDDCSMKVGRDEDARILINMYYSFDHIKMTVDEKDYDCHGLYPILVNNH